MDLSFGPRGQRASLRGMKPQLLPALLASVSLLSAAPPLEIDLFEGEAPGSPASADAEVLVRKEGDPIGRITHVQRPGLRVFLPEEGKRNGAAVVICPGGAYRILAIDHEGDEIARWLNSFGVAGIVCKYRVSDRMGEAYKYPVPLIDAREALRVTRRRAAEWGIDPQRVGIMGFSAGGHLASLVATLSAEKLPQETEPEFQKMEHRPDFAVLMYPVIGLTQEFAHGGSRSNLIAAGAPADLAERLSTHLRVDAHTPPTFLVATHDDKAVPPLNAVVFYEAMCRHGIPGELHVWEKGGHGFGLRPGHGIVTERWPQLLRDWMEGRDLLKAR